MMVFGLSHIFTSKPTRRYRRGSTAAGRRYSPEFNAIESRRVLSTITVTNDNDSGAGSLRQAIASANVVAVDTTIVFNLSAADSTILLTSGPLVNNPVNGTNGVIVDGTNGGTPVTINAIR